MLRTWTAAAILAQAERLAAWPPGLEAGLAVMAAQGDVEGALAVSITAEEARDRAARGVPLVPDTWASSAAREVAVSALADRLQRLVGTGGEDEESRRLVLAQAWRGVFRAAALALAPFVDTGSWIRATCPICGGAADFAALAGAGERRLLCGRCDAEWPYRRVACPFCGSEEHASLGYHPVGDGLYRLYVCTACSRYLKTVDLRRRPDACPPLERLLTAGLDASALAAGYLS